MILSRLHELAVRKQLSENPAFETQPVPIRVLLGADGDFLGIEERRNETVAFQKTKTGGAIARPRGRGDTLSVPRAHGNAGSPGFARFFVDTLPRVLPVVVEEAARAKIARSRATFWKQIGVAADETNDTALRAVQSFGRRLIQDAALRDQVAAAVAAKAPRDGDRVSFAYHADGGKSIMDRPVVRDWYAAYFQRSSATQQESGPMGFCTLTGTVGPIPTVHALKLCGIPGGLPTGVSIVSFDKAAYRHYDLEGAANAAISYRGADGYARAFQWLRGQTNHHLIFGDTLFLFWTRENNSTEFVKALDGADFEKVRPRSERLGQDQREDAAGRTDDFYLLAVSGNSARAIVRDYLERPLDQVRSSIGQWFADLRIADTSKEHQGKPRAAFPIWMLAAATAFDRKSVASDTRARLMHAALTGHSVPESLLVACLRRLRAEGSQGFCSSRMALIKLILIRKEVAVTDTLDLDERHPAYLCGRLLSVFEQIQFAALGYVNANVVDKFYVTFSAAPSLVCGQLMANARNHLRRLRVDDPDAYVDKDRRLTELLQLLGTTLPRSQFSLLEQGRFALGFYHEKAKQFEESAHRTAHRAAPAEVS